VRKDDDLAPEFRDQQIDPRPRRALAARILAILEYNGLSHGVIRNPERLIEEGRGDLDIWVPAKSMDSAIDLIEREVEAAGWWLLKRVRRPYVSSLYLYKPGRPSSALTVDIFPAIRWLVADLLPEALLAESLVRQGDFWIVDPQVGALGSCLHHLAWNEMVPVRYLENYRREDSGQDLPYSKLVRQIAADPNPDWRRMRRTLLTSAIGRSVILHPIRAGDEALRTVVSLARSSPGRWVAFEGPESNRYLIEIDRRLHEEHFLVGRWGSIPDVPERAPSRTIWYARNVRIKRWLGAIVLSSGDSRELRPDLRVWTDGSGWKAEGTVPAEPARGEDVGDLFQYLLTWFASECRMNIPQSREPNGIVVGLTGLNGATSDLARQLASETRLQPTAQHPTSPLKIRDAVLADTSQPKQGLGWLASSVRLAHYWWRSQVQFATTARQERRAGLVVLGDQSFFDVVINSAQFGIRLPRGVLSFAARVSLKPRLLLNLSSPSSPDMDHEGELTTVEPERLAQNWRTQLSRLVDTRILDASAAPMDLLNRAVDVIDSARRRRSHQSR
jgi:hypothetical protein